MEEKFNDLGVDALTGTEIMGLADVTTTDLADPIRFQRFKDVLDYVKTIPHEHRSYFIRKAVTGKNVDKLDHLWGYVELNKRKDLKAKELKKLDEEIGFYER